MDEDDSQSAARVDKGNLRLFDATLAHTGRQVKKRRVADQKNCQPPSLWRCSVRKTLSASGYDDNATKKKPLQGQPNAHVWEFG